MKVVFLDLDGVMNSGWYARDRRNYVVKEQGNIFKEIDPQAIKVLNDFCKETDAKIVISSSWRTTAYADNVLERAGFKGKVIGITPHIEGKYVLRGNEIYAWIKQNINLLEVDYSSNFKQYVIFDDDGDMLYWQRHHFFQTDTISGLTPNIAYRAKRFLLSQKNL